jgi:hypothetical protein
MLDELLYKSNVYCLKIGIHYLLFLERVDEAIETLKNMKQIIGETQQVTYVCYLSSLKLNWKLLFP